MLREELRELILDLQGYVMRQKDRGVRWIPPTKAPPSGNLDSVPVTPKESLPVPNIEVALEDGSPLSKVRAELGSCTRCGLSESRTHIVFGVGSETADLIVLGEAPGFHEDRLGEPFVGKAGQMLDKMLKHVLGLDRAETYILNVVKCRPPDNRNPKPDEIASCRPFLEGQIDAIQPSAILVLGAVAYRALFDQGAGITRNRGNWHEYRGVPVMPTFHPAYLLRKPSDKRLVFDDLKALRVKMDDLSS